LNKYVAPTGQRNSKVERLTRCDAANTTQNPHTNKIIRRKRETKKERRERKGRRSERTNGKRPKTPATEEQTQRRKCG
jgi:hypothetical protein